MSHHSPKASPANRALAQTYATRIVVGKLVLVLVGSTLLAVVFIWGSRWTPGVITTMALGCACLVSAVVGDFPAFVRCPACGKRMRARAHRDPHPHKRYRFLECPHCGRRVDLAAGSAFRPGR